MTHIDVNQEQLLSFVDGEWDRALPHLCDYVRIPNKSPMFDPDWERQGHMDFAARYLHDWCRSNPVENMHIEVLRLPGRTPLLYIDSPASDNDPSGECVLIYGHMDKQPEFAGWAAGLGPWHPVIRDGRLYGRGGADDGYAIFAALIAIRALEQQQIPHKRCVVLIEGSEESSSRDLPAYIEMLADRIGQPSLVICLDADCGDYEHLWCTTSLRGHITGTLEVRVLEEGVHSGMASGIVPSSMRIARSLLERLEDSATGQLKLRALHTEIPSSYVEQARDAAEVLSESIFRKWPAVRTLRPIADDPAELQLNSTWRPTLSITGAEGIPDLQNAGNVLRPYTTLKLSIRLPPTVDAQVAAQVVKATLEDDPPYHSQVQFTLNSASSGWSSSSTPAWLVDALQFSSKRCFGNRAMFSGVGGTIPFMRMLRERFPDSQFLVTGVLGPQSNAHGPNEFLDIRTAKRVTACAAFVIAAHFRLHPLSFTP